MPQVCPKCDTDMLPADDFDCDKADWVCPSCAPDFVLANSTSYSDVEDPLI